MKIPKSVLSVRVDKDLLEEVRSYVYWNRDMTLNKFVDKALRILLEQEDVIEKPVGATLHRGRPLHHLPKTKRE